MAKKTKKTKSTKQRDKKLQRKVATLIDDGDVMFDDLIEAGLGALADAVEAKKLNRFEKLRQRGAGLGIVIEVTDEGDDDDDDASDASMGEIVHRGGGWYDVVVAGVAIDRVRSREAAETRLLGITGGA